MENFIRWYDEAIPPSLCDQLIEAFESSDHKVTRDKPAKRNVEVSVIPGHLTDQLVKIINLSLIFLIQTSFVKLIDFP